MPDKVCYRCGRKYGESIANYWGQEYPNCKYFDHKCQGELFVFLTELEKSGKAEAE